MAEVEKLQEAIREFVAGRDWEQFHSPKNLSMALAVEVAELMEFEPDQKPGGFEFVGREDELSGLLGSPGLDDVH